MKRRETGRKPTKIMEQHSRPATKRELTTKHAKYTKKKKRNMPG